MIQQTSLEDGAVQQEMLAHPIQSRRKPDPMIGVLLVALVVGVLCMLITGWVVYTRQHKSRARGQSQQIVGLESKLQGTSKELATVYAQATLAGSLKQAYEAQRTELDRLNAELIQMRDTLETVSAAATPAVVLAKPPLALVLDAPVYKQARSLSCESSSAAMAANFFGIQASEAQILASLPLDENPHKGFRGNVDGAYGGLQDYGVYAEPIRQVLTDLGLTVEAFSGGMEDIRGHLRQGRVLVAWITYDLQVQIPRPVTLDSGEVVTMVPYEHALLIVGYNSDGFWVNDPYTGTGKFYTEREFVRSFAYLGNMALVVGPPK
ncbi:MAG: C39 family peptidase [Anaerolineae bacterium]|nr:C39 family peptidase [Anaerolineae bacterium]